MVFWILGLTGALRPFSEKTIQVSPPQKICTFFNFHHFCNIINSKYLYIIQISLFLYNSFSLQACTYLQFSNLCTSFFHLPFVHFSHLFIFVQYSQKYHCTLFAMSIFCTIFTKFFLCIFTILNFLYNLYRKIIVHFHHSSISVQFLPHTPLIKNKKTATHTLAVFLSESMVFLCF